MNPNEGLYTVLAKPVDSEQPMLEATNRCSMPDIEKIDFLIVDTDATIKQFPYFNSMQKGDKFDFHLRHMGDKPHQYSCIAEYSHKNEDGTWAFSIASRVTLI